MYQRYTQHLKSVGVKKVEDLGYGWAFYLSKFYEGSQPVFITLLTKGSKIIFLNRMEYDKYYKLISASGSDLTGMVTPRQFVKGLTSAYTLREVSKRTVQTTLPATVYQKFKDIIS